MNTKNTSREIILNQVKNVVLSHISNKHAKAYLFGSWARSEEKQSSDIDVAIEFSKHFPENRMTIINIRTALEESTIPYRVDVVHLNTADEIIISKVKKEGIAWDD